MSYEERNTLVGIIVNLITTSYMIMRLRQLRASGALEAPDAVQVWAQAFLWVVPIAIGATIALVILFNIVFAIATRDENPDFTVDERDKVFQMRGMATTMIVASFGFLGAMIGLALGWAPVTGLIVIYFSYAAGDMAGNLFKLFNYRVGG